MSERTLMFCVALNHYDRIYDRNIVSHRAYAARHGYRYALVRGPRRATVRESAWLKIPLIQSALERGYHWVLFVDADCEIRSDAPPIASVAVADKDVYLAPGFSGNVNSGVVIARNGPGGRRFFADVLGAADVEVPEQDWGENGHIIHFAARNDAVTLLSRRWNNNADPGLNDFVRHYSAGGPMRSLYRMSLQGHSFQLLVRVRNRLWKMVGQHDVPNGMLGPRLARLAASCMIAYPPFAPCA